MPRTPQSFSGLSSPPSRVLSPSTPSLSPTAALRALELSSNDTLGDSSTRDKQLRGRSDTIASLGGFDFEHALLPLSLSRTDEEINDGANNEHVEHKHVGLLHGMALVVGMQVGSGIFSSPGVVVASVGSVGASLMVWIVSGLLAWTGASSFAELGCAIPLSGGAQAYLAYSFGPMASYLYTWAAVSTLKPGSSAIIALIFGEYINRMLYHAVSGDVDGSVPEWTFKVTAIFAILLVSALNVVSPTMGTHSAVVLTTIKIGSLIFVAVLGLIYLLRHGPGPAFDSSSFFAGSSTEPSSYAIALYSGLWAFDGWDQCSFVAGEMKNPNRDLPRALHSSMSIVLILFLSANISYFVVLDPVTVGSSNTVALDFGRVTIGKFGAIVFSTLVSISCFGALNGGFYTNHFLPSLFSKLHPRRRTPDNAMALQATLTVLFVVFGGGFRTLLNFFSVTSWTMYLATVLGLLVLRVKEPHLDRPYRAWIITPIIFCAVAMFLLLMPIFAAPWESLAAFLFMAAGVPVYYLTTHSRAQQAGKGFGRAHAEDGIRATLESAWVAFTDDIASILPANLGDLLRQTGPTRTTQAVGLSEERRGMLDQVEMSER